jgi:hypothetical protein
MALVVGRDMRCVTYRWNARFFCTKIYNVTAGDKSEGNETPNDVVANPGPVHSLVVGPWLHVTGQAVSS